MTNLTRMRKYAAKVRPCDHRISPGPNDPGPYACVLAADHKGPHCTNRGLQWGA